MLSFSIAEVPIQFSVFSSHYKENFEDEDAEDVDQEEKMMSLTMMKTICWAILIRCKKRIKIQFRKDRAMDNGRRYLQG